MRLLSRGVCYAPARCFVTGTLAVVAILIFGTAVLAVSPNDIVRVDEDWELVVGQPEPTTAAPQVTSVISPTGNLDSWHVAFELNHQTLPSYEPGGLFLQLWRGEVSQNVDGDKFGSVLCQPDGETITWTQTMSISGSVVTFEVTNGNSTTWGHFGNGGELRLSADTALHDLDAYRPEVSAENSGVGFASNRVHSFTLKRVRLHRANGEIEEVNVDLTVHELE